MKNLESVGFLEYGVKCSGAMALTVRMRRIGCLGPIIIDNQIGRTRICVFPVNQQVRYDLSEDLVPETDSLDTIKVERIGQMLCHKIHQ